MNSFDMVPAIPVIILKTFKLRFILSGKSGGKSMTRITVFLLFIVSFSLVYAENWPSWRGPEATGVSSETGIPAQWDLSKNIKWKVKVPGLGHSSPIIWGDRIFITTAVNSNPAEEDFQKGFPMVNRKSDTGDISWKVLCYERATGKLLWEKTAITQKPANGRHIKNSYASQSPVADGAYVFAFFGDQGMYCFDFNGKLVWSKNLGSFTMRSNWGLGSSPVLYKNFVIQTCDQETGKSFIIALNKNTGETAWKTDRDELSSWSTPFVYAQEGRPELVVNATNAVRSYDPETGKLLWECRGPATSITTPAPTFSNGLIIVSSGFIMDRIKPITAFKPGASGDITLKQGEASSESIVWRQQTGAPYIPSPIAYDGRIYVVLDNGIIACYDAKTGKEIYGKQRIDVAASGFSASPVAMEGKLFCPSEDGDVYVIKAGDRYELLAKNSLAAESIMASPAISGGNLFIRSIKHLYCIQK
jgi:outer membrane protein assembly factor BamB